MYKASYLSLCGLRGDGRRWDEIRNISHKMSVLRHTDGSAYLEMGQTKVLAYIIGPHDVKRRSEMDHKKCILKCEANITSYSSLEKKKKKSYDKTTNEISIALKQTFESAILLDLYPRSQIDIYIHVLQKDGSTISACINAATLALIDSGIAMKDMVVSCSSGYTNGEVIMDLNYLEQSGETPYLPIAILPRTDDIILAQLNSKIPYDVVENLIDVGIQGCHKIFNILQDVIRIHTQNLFENQLIDVNIENNSDDDNNN